MIQYATDQHQTNFYTISGTSGRNLGIDADRKAHHIYEVVGQGFDVLVSRTAGLGPKQAGQNVLGGGVQIMIPDPIRNLKLIPKPRSGN